MRIPPTPERPRLGRAARVALALAAAAFLLAAPACSPSKDKKSSKTLAVTVPATVHTLAGRYAIAGSTPEAGATYAWSQVSGPTAAALSTPSAASTVVDFPWAGTYVLRLTATHGKDSGSADATVKVHSVDGGDAFSVAVKPDGTVWTWGDNSSGQLGNPDAGASSAAPVPVCAFGYASACDVYPLTGVVAVSAGSAHVVALKSDGSVISWGNNFHFELGAGESSTANAASPVRVCAVGETVDACANYLSGVKSVSAGYQFSTALLTTGEVAAWGFGGHGELGNGYESPNFSVPALVCDEGEVDPCTNHLNSVVGLASGGGGHTLAMDGFGGLWGWGENKNGQAGVGSAYFDTSDPTHGTIVVPTPVCAPGTDAVCTEYLTGVVAVDAWSALSLALKGDGTLWTWGHNDYNQLGVPKAATEDTDCYDGVPNKTCSKVPIQVCADASGIPCTTPLTRVAAMAAGRRWSMALKDDGTVWTWGSNQDSALTGRGQLGDGTLLAHTAPAQVCAPGTAAGCTTYLADIAGVATGSTHAFAIGLDGTLWSWGANDAGQVGDDGTADRSVPVQVSGY